MKNVAFMFPGQGSQYVGMGKYFYENFGEIFEKVEKKIPDFLYGMILNDFTEIDKVRILEDFLHIICQIICE